MTHEIHKGAENRIIVTLTELQDDSMGVNWLFRYNKDQGKNEHLVFLDDISVHTGRYNMFMLNEGTDVTFTYTGDYMYRVYQMPDTLDTDYTRGKLVEIGKAKVIEPEQSRNTYTPNKNKNVYRG